MKCVVLATHEPMSSAKDSICAEKSTKDDKKKQQMNCEITALYAIAILVAGLGIDPKPCPYAAFPAVDVL